MVGGTTPQAKILDYMKGRKWAEHKPSLLSSSCQNPPYFTLEIGSVPKTACMVKSYQKPHSETCAFQAVHCGPVSGTYASSGFLAAPLPLSKDSGNFSILFDSGYQF